MAVIQGIRGRPWRTFARDKSEGVGKAYNAGRAARPFAAVVVWEKRGAMSWEGAPSSPLRTVYNAG